LDGARRRAFADDDIKDASLHSGVENFFDGAIESMDFVDEKNITRRKISEDGCKVADAFDSGTGCCTQICTEFFCYQMRKCCFTEAWRTVKKDMLGLLFAAFGGRKEDAKIFLDRRLADVVIPLSRAECLIECFGASCALSSVVFGHISSHPTSNRVPGGGVDKVSFRVIEYF
jgi:hypothetical protein